MNNRIRVARAEVHMTQQELAERCGVSRQTINAIESGKFVPSTLLALKIARIFGKPVEAVFELAEGDCTRSRSRAISNNPRKVVCTSFTGIR